MGTCHCEDMVFKQSSLRKGREIKEFWSRIGCHLLES